MTRFQTDALAAPHTQRHLDAIPQRNPAHVYHGTPHHQAASLAAKDAEISQLASALNKAKEENDRLRSENAELKQDISDMEMEMRVMGEYE